ncbi:hypothetical protein Tco_0415424 [Tanacetum coccineum]
MITVAIHLPDEAILGGPIRYRWMFPFERYMKKLKNYVRNKAKPEGSIAEGYVAEEALTFVRVILRMIREMKATRLTTDVRQAVVWFVLNNSPEVDADILAYREKSPDNVETNFPAWFNHKLCGTERDILHTTQCSGVSTLGLDGEMYYGQLEEILELTYIGNRKVVLFRCKWEFPKNNQYILANKYTRIQLEDLARQPTWLEGVENMFITETWQKRGTPYQLRMTKLMLMKAMLMIDVLHIADSDDDNQSYLAVRIFPDHTVGGMPVVVHLGSTCVIETRKCVLKAGVIDRDIQDVDSLNGGTVKYLPLACEWEEIPEAYKAHIFPTLEKVQKGHYEDLIETWRKTHSRPETGEFKTQKNLKRYLDMKSMQDQVRAGVIPYKTDQDILDEVVPSTNRQNMSGKGRKLPGGGSTSRRRGPQAFPDVISREEMDRILRQRDQEAELLRKQTAEAQQRHGLIWLH